MGAFLHMALDYHARGWCILPIRHKTERGKEPACRRWVQYQQERPDPQTLRRWFGREDLDGLAVMAGDVSGSLVVRDFDRLGSYIAWAESQPELAEALPTVETAQGRHVYVQADVRGIHHLGDGELRGKGYTLLPPSVHPTGHVYCWQVPLPDGPLPEVDPLAAGLATPVTEQAEQTEQTEQTNAMIRGELDSSPTVEEAIASTLPQGEGQRNACVFEFARTLKAIPEYADADPCDLRPLVREWHRRALPVIRTRPFEETWTDFVYGWGRVMFPKGQEPMAEIFAKALEADVPAVAQEYEQPQVRLLAALCRELQRASGDNPFYLACRTAGKLLGVKHMTASRWLYLLTIDGVLAVVEKGGRSGTARRATRYRYVGD